MKPSNENIYPEGMLVTAKADPTQPLIVVRYYQRIYYCAVANDLAHKHFAYFERELIPSIQPEGKTSAL